MAPLAARSAMAGLVIAGGLAGCTLSVEWGSSGGEVGRWLSDSTLLEQQIEQRRLEIEQDILMESQFPFGHVPLPRVRR